MSPPWTSRPPPPWGSVCTRPRAASRSLTGTRRSGRWCPTNSPCRRWSPVRGWPWWTSSPEQHFTKPPARYTEASLVKALEKEGIGRPSTYATIISTIQDRRYVEQMDKKFHATDLGEVVTDKLNEYFPTIMDVAFTRFMEEQLDKIAEQHLDWVGVLTEFYGPFKQSLETAQQQMKHAKAEVTPSEYTCTQCGKPMVYRLGKNGRFLSCSGYPDCKFASPCDKEGKMVQDNVVSEHACPVCHKPMVLKRGRFGQFLGCSRLSAVQDHAQAGQARQRPAAQTSAPAHGHQVLQVQGRGAGHPAEQEGPVPGLCAIPQVQDHREHQAARSPQGTSGRRSVAACQP